MRLLFLISMMFFKFNSYFTQEYAVKVSYSYLFSPQFDKVIQAYNFSRPFQDHNQPLFMNGFSFGLNNNFQTQGKFKSGLKINYSVFRSYAQNPDFNNSYHLSFLEIGYSWTYPLREDRFGSSFEFDFSALASSLKRKINDENFEFKEGKNRAYGIGGNLSFRYLYALKFNQEKILSPFVGVNCSPYLYAPNTESVINQTNSLYINPWVTVVKLDFGLKVQF